MPPVSTAEAIRLLSLRRETASAVAPAEAVSQAPVKTLEQRRAEQAAVVDRLEKAMRRFRPLGQEWGRVHDLHVAPEQDHPKLAAVTKTLECPHCRTAVRLRFPEADLDNPARAAG